MTRHAIKSAVLWSGIDIFFRQGLQFFISMALARLLNPSDFGTLAIVSLVLSVSAIISEVGACQALIQKSDLTPRGIASAFWLNMAMSVFITMLIAFFLVDYIATYFKQPELISIVKVASLNLVLLGAQNIQRAMLTKALKFKVLAIISLISSFVSGIIAVTLAFFDFGVWSLVIQILIGSAISGLLLACRYRFEVIFTYDLVQLKSLIRFGAWISLGSIFNAFRGGITTLVLGGIYSLQDLGLYLRAEGTNNLAANTVCAPVERIMLPLIAQANSDSNSGIDKVIKIARLMMVIHAPVMLILAINSHAIIELLFGNKWISAGPYLSALAISTVLLPIHMVNVQLLLATGHSRLNFLLDVAKFSVSLILIVVASQFGILAIAWVQVLISLLGWVINSFYTGRVFSYDFFKQLKSFYPIILISSFCGIISLIPKLIFDPHGLLCAAISSLIFGATFIAIGYVTRFNDILFFLQKIIGLISKNVER